MQTFCDRIAVFWDYENVSLSKSAQTFDAVRCINDELQKIYSSEFGEAARIAMTLYCSMSTIPAERRAHFTQSGVRLVDVTSPKGIKEACDKMIMLDMLFEALNSSPRPRCLVLVSEDGDYAPMLQRLRNENFFIVVLYRKALHRALHSAAHSAVNVSRLLVGDSPGTGFDLLPDLDSVVYALDTAESRGGADEGWVPTETLQAIMAESRAALPADAVQWGVRQHVLEGRDEPLPAVRRVGDPDGSDTASIATSDPGVGLHEQVDLMCRRLLRRHGVVPVDMAVIGTLSRNFTARPNELINAAVACGRLRRGDDNTLLLDNMAGLDADATDEPGRLQELIAEMPGAFLDWTNAADFGQHVSKPDREQAVRLGLVELRQVPGAVGKEYRVLQGGAGAV